MERKTLTAIQFGYACKRQRPKGSSDIQIKSMLFRLLLSHKQPDKLIGAGPDVHYNPSYQHLPTAGMMLLATIGVGGNITAEGYDDNVTVCLRA